MPLIGSAFPYFRHKFTGTQTGLGNRGLSWESTRGGLGLWHMLGTGDFRSKKVNFLGTSAGEGWFIWIRKPMKASLGLTGNP